MWGSCADDVPYAVPRPVMLRNHTQGNYEVNGNDRSPYSDNA
jgi:hypothetical protein